MKQTMRRLCKICAGTIIKLAGVFTTVNCKKNTPTGHDLFMGQWLYTSTHTCNTQRDPARESFIKGISAVRGINAGRTPSEFYKRLQAPPAAATEEH